MPRVIPMERPRRVGKGLDARRALLAKVHIARKQLAIEEDSYRALLQRVTGKDSAADLSLGQLEKVLTEFARLGFTSTPRSKAGSKGGLPSEAQAKKIRALWLNLYHLGELESGAEEALIAYCNRMSGVARIEWMHSEQFDNVIRGLRGWLQRVGWENPTADYVDALTRARLCAGLDADPKTAVNWAGIAAKAATVRAQYKVLGRVLDGFQPEMLQPYQLDMLIEANGEACRAAKASQKGGK